MCLHRIKTDLRAVKQKIEAGAFRSILEFQRALCTMFLNVQMMHPIGTEVSKSNFNVNNLSAPFDRLGH